MATAKCVKPSKIRNPRKSSQTTFVHINHHFRVRTPSAYLTGFCHHLPNELLPLGSMSTILCSLELCASSKDTLRSKSFQLWKKVSLPSLLLSSSLLLLLLALVLLTLRRTKPSAGIAALNELVRLPAANFVHSVQRQHIVELPVIVSYGISETENKDCFISTKCGYCKVCFDIVWQGDSILNCSFQNSTLLLLGGRVVPGTRLGCWLSFQCRHGIALECRKSSPQPDEAEKVKNKALLVWLLLGVHISL